jgi:hypothetical protein
MIPIELRSRKEDGIIDTIKDIAETHLKIRMNEDYEGCFFEVVHWEVSDFDIFQMPRIRVEKFTDSEGIIQSRIVEEFLYRYTCTVDIHKKGDVNDYITYRGS